MITFYAFIIQFVLSFCEGEYVVVTINREWRNTYLRLHSSRITVVKFYNIHQLDFFMKCGYIAKSNLLLYFVKIRNLQALELIHSYSCKWSPIVTEEAAKLGHLDILNWIIGKYPCNYWKILEIATETCSENLLTWLAKRKYIMNYTPFPSRNKVVIRMNPSLEYFASWKI